MGQETVFRLQVNGLLPEGYYVQDTTDLFLGVNLLSREGNSLAGHKMALEERLEERFMVPSSSNVTPTGIRTNLNTGKDFNHKLRLV